MRLKVLIALFLTVLLFPGPQIFSEEEISEDFLYSPERIVNLPTGVNLPTRNLGVVILHRFAADLTKGEEVSRWDFWGFDKGVANMAFDLSYGLIDWNLAGKSQALSLGIHRSTRKLFEAYSQISLLQEFNINEDGDLYRESPFSLSLRFAAATFFIKNQKEKWSGNFHLILAKRIIPQMHFYLVPTYTSRTDYSESGKNVATGGIGIYLAPFIGTGWSFLRFVGEYQYPYYGFKGIKDTWSAGIHLATAGHAFAIFVTNNIHTTLNLNSQSGRVKELHLGFNIQRQYGF